MKPFHCVFRILPRVLISFAVLPSGCPKDEQCHCTAAIIPRNPRGACLPIPLFARDDIVMTKCGFPLADFVTCFKGLLDTVWRCQLHSGKSRGSTCYLAVTFQKIWRPNIELPELVL